MILWLRFYCKCSMLPLFWAKAVWVSFLSPFLVMKKLLSYLVQDQSFMEREKSFSLTAHCSEWISTEEKHTKPLLPIHKYDCDGTFSSDTAELNSHRLPYKQRKESVSHKLQMYVPILTFLPSHGFCGRLGSETTHCLHLVPTCLGINTSERTEQPKLSVRPAHIHVITTPCTQPLELFL